MNQKNYFTCDGEETNACPPYREQAIELKMSEGLQYHINADGKTCTIMGRGNCADQHIVIPPSIDGYTVTVIGDSAFHSYTNGNILSIVIPDSVTKIGDKAFESCTNLKLAALGNSVSSIGWYAFKDCANLSMLSIPESVVSIGYDAFCGCGSLARVNIPASVMNIGRGAFSGVGEVWVSDENRKYRSIDGNLYSKDAKILMHYATNKTAPVFVIPDFVTEITYEAFCDCKHLVRAEIPDSVVRMGSYLFCGCENLTSVTVGNSVTNIGEASFRSCEKLARVSLGSAVSAIGPEAFFDCKSLSDVKLPELLKTVGRLAFAGCSGLTEIVIPGFVAEIGESAFCQCENLARVTLSASVTEIGERAFSGCRNLKELRYTGTREKWMQIRLGEGWASDSEISEIRCNVSAAQIPKKACSMGLQYRLNPDGKTCEIMGIGACEDRNLVIPERIGNITVTSVGAGAFRDRKEIARVEIPNTVTAVADEAFRGCAGLTETVIGNSVTFIGAGAFRDCTRLAEAVIPASVEQIGKAAFAGAGKLSVSPDNRHYVSADGNLYTADGKILLHYASNGERTEFEIPECVKTIEALAFFGCVNLAHVTVGDSVSEIGENAFRWCRRLKSVSLGKAVTAIAPETFMGCSALSEVRFNTVTEIGKDAFTFCTALKEMTLPACVTAVGERAFWGCSGLARVTVSENVTVIGAGAFSQCRKLKELRYLGTPSAWASITFANGWSKDSAIREIDFSATSGDREISRGLDYRVNEDGRTCSVTGMGVCKDSRLVIPEAVLSFRVTGIGDGAFLSRSELTGLVILGSVTSIGVGAFGNCENLFEADIADVVTSVGDGAFSGCGNLSSLRYAGTKRQWKKIALGKKWRAGTSLRAVDCTDKPVKFLF